jgi:hypothetical protein
MFNEHGKDITDLQMIYYCAWMEMKAMRALDQKLVEAAPERPKAPELETSIEGYKKHCLAVLKRLVDLGFDKEELGLDPAAWAGGLEETAGQVISWAEYGWACVCAWGGRLR